VQVVVETQCQVKGSTKDDLATTCMKKKNTQTICEMLSMLDMNEQQVVPQKQGQKHLKPIPSKKTKSGVEVSFLISIVVVFNHSTHEQ
jgi:hypothetical protein